MTQDPPPVPGLESVKDADSQSFQRDVMVLHPRAQPAGDTPDLGNHRARVTLGHQPNSQPHHHRRRQRTVVPPDRGGFLCGIPVGGRGAGLVGDGADHPDGGVSAVVVVEPVAPVQYDGLGRFDGSEVMRSDTPSTPIRSELPSAKKIRESLRYPTAITAILWAQS